MVEKNAVPATGRNLWIGAWVILAMIGIGTAITTGPVDVSGSTAEKRLEEVRLKAEIVVVKEKIDGLRVRLDQGRNALEQLYIDSGSATGSASSLAFWRERVDKALFNNAVIEKLEGKMAQAENLLAEHHYLEARALYHEVHTDYSQKLGWFLGRETVWQNESVRLSSDRQRASYGLAALFAQSNISMIRHKIDLGRSYAGIEDFFQAVPVRYSPQDIIGESQITDGADHREQLGMLSYYVGYEMARIAEKTYRRYSVGKNGIDRVRLLAGWRDYVQGKTERVCEEETWGILALMLRDIRQ
ncbi:hypothetical protein [Marinobacter litoralis]|uniref:hypothetical protein n=1 Tax=Marinobacter litoralis TaxID=187981 RepID=UPI0018EB1961|nr:hypothetical protein [Marinobacter litoralis]MBJ6136984.1 hypothetical protein [Marinobacter litoralis]